MRKTVFVIECNNSVEAVCIGTKQEADKIRKQLRSRDKTRNPGYYGGRLEFYWHVHEVPLFDMSQHRNV